MQLISFQDGSAIEVPEPPDLSSRPILTTGPPARAAVLKAVRIRDLARSEPAIRERLGRLAGGDARALRRPLAAAAVGDRLVLLAEAPDGPSLRTVLRLVPLTWEQAVVLGEGLLTALRQLQAQDLVHGDISSATAVLGTDGRVRLTDPAPMAPAAPTGPAGSDSRQAARLLSKLLGEVSPPSLRSVPDAVRSGLLGVISDMAEDGTPAAAALAAWRRAASPRLDRQGRARVGRQLQALATRLPWELAAGAAPPAGIAAAVDRAAEPRARPGLTADRPSRWPLPAGVDPLPPPGPAPLAGSGPTRRQGWLAAGILVLLLAVGGGALLATRGGPHGSNPSPATGHVESPSPPATPAQTPSPSPTPATSPTPSPTLSSTPSTSPLPAVPDLGPASNPPVEQVQLEAGCTSTGSQGCQLTLTADLGPHQPLTVAWEIDEVNRCDGAVTTVASGQIPAPADYTYVQAQPQVNLLSGVPLALVGLAGAPGQAASLPLSITPPGAECLG